MVVDQARIDPALRVEQGEERPRKQGEREKRVITYKNSLPIEAYQSLSKDALVVAYIEDLCVLSGRETITTRELVDQLMQDGIYSDRGVAESEIFK
jgi:hypothetical protein